MSKFNMFLTNDIKPYFEELMETKPVTFGRPDPNLPINMYQHKDRLAKTGHKELAKFLHKFNKFQTAYLISILKAAEDGPKIICPTFEECLVLEQIEIKVPFSEYQQPFPVVLVDFPYKYYEYLKNRTGRPAPKCAIVFHSAECNFISVHMLYKCSEFEDITAFLDPSMGFDTIEDALIALENIGVKDQDVVLARIVERVLLNLNMVLVSEGFRQTEIVEKRNKQKVKDRPVTLIGFEQHIKLYHKEIMKTVSVGDGTHKSPHPHWRRGHYRRQPYGQKATKRKRVFIKPTFVCSDSFAGDLSTTSVEYQVGKDNVS